MDLEKTLKSLARNPVWILLRQYEGYRRLVGSGRSKGQKCIMSLWLLHIYIDELVKEVNARVVRKDVTLRIK